MSVESRAGFARTLAALHGAYYSLTGAWPLAHLPSFLAITGSKTDLWLVQSFGALCQWFHFEDERFDLALRWLKELGVKKLRTGLSWADSLRPGALRWFDRQMAALEPFEVTVTFCFTPESEGLRAHHTSPPRDPRAFADFCAAMVKRYGG